MFDRVSGEIDPEVAQAWKKYDISLILLERWKELAPSLAGKIHVYMGNDDTFYLDKAALLMKTRCQENDIDVEVVMLPGDHSSILFGTLSRQMLKDRRRRPREGLNQAAAMVVGLGGLRNRKYQAASSVARPAARLRWPDGRSWPEPRETECPPIARIGTAMVATSRSSCRQTRTSISPRLSQHRSFAMDRQARVGDDDQHRHEHGHEDVPHEQQHRQVVLRTLHPSDAGGRPR